MEQPLAASRLLCLDGPSGNTVLVLAVAGGGEGGYGGGEGVADDAAAERLRAVKDMVTACLALG
jgi:hypothetical protein